MLEISVRKRRAEFSLDVVFSAPTPGVVTLFGRSGCGKTTVVNIIAGLLDPDDGSIRVDGTTFLDIACGESLPAEHRQIGYVFQDARLFPHLNVLGNLRYGQKRAPRGAQHISRDDVVDLLGLVDLLDRRTQQLSGGERQRVALGRALLAQPRLLLLDEPLASLDAGRREEVLPYLERLRDHLAIPMVYVSHQFEEVLRLATYIVLMEGGSVVGHGDVRSMSLKPELRALAGAEAIGAVLEGKIEIVNGDEELARLRIGNATLWLSAAAIGPGLRVRVQVLARDVIIATSPPHGLSVRNALEGVISRIEPDPPHSDLVYVDIGSATIISRVTRTATRELALRTGVRAWALVKAVSLLGRAFAAPGIATLPEQRLAR